MLVVNENVSADIYCDEDTAAIFMSEYEKVRTNYSWAEQYKQHDADESIQCRVRIHNLPARIFYRLIEQFRDHIYE